MSRSKRDEGHGGDAGRMRPLLEQRNPDKERPEHYLPLDRRSAARFLSDWEAVTRGQLRRLRAEEDEVLYRVFDRALGGLPNFRGESRISTWLYRITYREALRHLERRGRLAAREAPIEAALRVEGSGEDNPERLLERRESAETVKRALALLDTRDRELLALRFLEDLKLTEVADRLDLPLGTVKTGVHRALKRLRQELDHE
jgi:RNA polymerase sigma factor (sigma-70 family)